MNFLDYCINIDYTVKEAMKVLDKVEPKIIFILEHNQIMASLTDGDIRRFLINGGSLSDRAIIPGNKSPLCAYNKSDARTLCSNKKMVAIPILNAKSEVIDIYFGKKNLCNEYSQLNIPVVINAGGKGTRLEPYTKILPKPLIPVGELPIIEYIMQQFKKYSCEYFSVIVNYKRALLKAYFADCDRKYNITWYDEKAPLGTGGGLCYLKGKIDTTFFFTNCDNLLLADCGEILQFHRDNSNVITMIGTYKNITIPYGVVEMGVSGAIESMQEKPEFSVLINTGIYIVEPEVLDDIEDQIPMGFPEIIEKQRKKGKRVAVYPISENDWLDMGQFSELESMKKKISQRREDME